MRIPSDQRFYLEREDQLADEIRRLGLPLSLGRDGSILGQGIEAGGRKIANRFCARTGDGCDAEEHGEPSALTYRRYTRLAQGGTGLICTEPVAIDREHRRHPRQMLLHTDTVASFASLVDVLQDAASSAGVSRPLLFLQLDDAAMMAGETAACGARYAAAARMAMSAGFDGLEIRCESGEPLAEIEVAIANAIGDADPFDAFPLRVTQVIQAIRAVCPNQPLAVRLCVYTARINPIGFGTARDDFRMFDPEYPIRLVRRFQQLGVCLLNMTGNYPALRAIPELAAAHPIPPDGYPHEHPLAALARMTTTAGILRGSVPGLLVAVGGFSWLRQMMPLVAAGAIDDGLFDMVALERFALAYPDAPAEWLRHHQLDPYRCCIQCGACGELRQAGTRVGCVLQDSSVYGPAYRSLHRDNHLTEEAQRCHRCMPAPCSRATPAGLNISGFMRAYAKGDVRRAGRLLRSQQVLPEMCALLSPYGASGERDCIETVLTGTAVPIRDLQYSAACGTRDDASATVNLPVIASGLHVAVAGGGPAGIAAAAVLLAHGHTVTLYEQSTLLGGVPERLIPVTRYYGTAAEIEALLGPARRAGRLKVLLNTSLGSEVTVANARSGANALLLTVGLWKEKSLGVGIGIYSGLDFLEMAKTGAFDAFRGRAVVLAGGDCAMDASVVLKAAGVDPLTILFGGSRAEMHWCMEDSWFAQPGVHARMLCRPVGYRLGADGRVTGVRFLPMDPASGGGAQALSGGESILAADLVIEATGLEAADSFRASFPTLQFTADGRLQRPNDASFGTGLEGVFAAGALINGGASVPQCVEEGTRAAGEIHAWISARRLGGDC